MTKEELHSNLGYWLADWQLELYHRVLTKTPEELSKQLDIPLETAKSILDIDYNGSISEFIEICLKLGFHPILNLEKL